MTTNELNYHHYKECIDACLACGAVCNHCASSCLKEDKVQMMAQCIQLDMECAAMCYATAQVMSLGGSQALQLATLLADICDACGAECGKHDTKHCKECAAACKKCADICRRMNNW